MSLIDSMVFFNVCNWEGCSVSIELRSLPYLLKANCFSSAADLSQVVWSFLPVIFAFNHQEGRLIVFILKLPIGHLRFPWVHLPNPHVLELEVDLELSLLVPNPFNWFILLSSVTIVSLGPFFWRLNRRNELVIASSNGDLLYHFFK
jgi:hypothetical protein